MVQPSKRLGASAKNAPRARIVFSAAFLAAASHFSAPSSAADDPLAEAVASALSEVIQPDFRAFADAADAQLEALRDLCEAPGPERLRRTRETFEATVLAWSRVEMYRTGPAREKNRHTRLFYWPDRKGRGLRQVRRLLASDDDAALDPGRLQEKSVAVQGIPALEYVLYGAVADDPEAMAGRRCAYGRAIAGAVAGTARELSLGWEDQGTYVRAMRNPGADNALFRSSGESLQMLLGAARSQLQAVRDLKIGASVGGESSRPRPKRAPLWRSNLTAASMIANLDSVAALFAQGGIDAALPAGRESHARALAIEIAQASKAIQSVGDAPWTETAGSGPAREQLLYARIPLGGAIDLVAGSYPAALGVTIGFNAFDGD